MEQRDQTPRQIMDSAQYDIRKQIVRRDINKLIEREGKDISGVPVGIALDSFAPPRRLYPVDYTVFKKTDEEKGQLLTMKKQLPKTRHYKFVTILKGDF